MLNTTGWQAGDKPPADWLNYLFNTSYLVLKELQEKSINVDQKAIANGVATLGADGKVPAAQLSISAPADASTTVKGIVMLEDSFASTSITTAATPKSVKSAYDLAQQAFTSANNGKALTGPVATAIVGKGGVVADADSDGIATFAELQTGVNSIIQAQGNATTAQVLSGTTFTSGLYGAQSTGIMPNRAGDTVALASSVVGTTLKLRASNGYRDGVDDNVTLTDADFIPANILSGKDIFGVVGTLTLGKKWASGTVATTTAVNFKNHSDTNTLRAAISVTGLTFKPSSIIVYTTGSAVFSATTYQATANVGQTSALNCFTATTASGSFIKEVSPLAVTVTGFTLPHSSQSTGEAMSWIAIE
jgi:hypothetical protein